MSEQSAPAREPIATAMNIGRQLLDALGVEPSGVTGLQLIVNAGHPVKLVVTRLITESQGLAVAKLLTDRFDLVERATEGTEETVKLPAVEGDAA